MVLMSWVMVGTIACVGDNGDVLVLGRAELETQPYDTPLLW